MQKCAGRTEEGKNIYQPHLHVLLCQLDTGCIEHVLKSNIEKHTVGARHHHIFLLVKQTRRNHNAVQETMNNYRRERTRGELSMTESDDLNMYCTMPVCKYAYITALTYTHADIGAHTETLQAQSQRKRGTHLEFHETE